jgi:hypothetical protein
MKTTLLASWHLIKNKAVAIALSLVLGGIYSRLSAAGQPVAFAELLYTAILVSAVTVLAPLSRLLVFPEVARYAESGQLGMDLKCRDFTPALIHYWFATALCYGLCIACLASLAH